MHNRSTEKPSPSWSLNSELLHLSIHCEIENSNQDIQLGSTPTEQVAKYKQLHVQ
jgi:hypothetical protein